MEKNKQSDVFLPHYDFLLMAKILTGKNVDFNTTHYSFKGVIGEIFNAKNKTICITIVSTKFRKKFTADNWEPWRTEYLNVALTEKDTIWKIRDTTNDVKIYVASLNCNNMTIHNTR